LDQGGERFLAPPLVARVQNYLVSPLNEKLSGRSAEPVGKTCNEYPRHDFSSLSSKDAAKALHDTGARSGGGIYPDQIGTPPFSRRLYAAMWRGKLAATLRSGGADVGAE